LDQKWETFTVEKSVKHILKKAAKKVGLAGKEYEGRVDLALRSGEHLLVVEFMKPGKPLDLDHLNRCENYVLTIRTIIEAESDLRITRVTSLVVADKSERSPVLIK